MKTLFAVLAVFLFAVTPATVAPPALPVTVFINGNVYTVNEKQPHAQAIVVVGNSIAYVGSNAGAKRFQNNLVRKGWPKDPSRVVDLRGATVLPGLADAHAHFTGVGQREMNLNLEGITTLEDFLAKVKERVDQAKPGEWVTGRGWIETFWKPPVFPTRADLDKVAPNNPVYLTRADGHASVANSAALKIAGLTKDTKDPFGGQVLKDKTTGEPTGMLIDTAQGLVSRHIPPRGEGSAEEAMVLANKRSIELGWTQIHDAGGSYREVELFKKLYAEGKLKIRLYKAVHGPSADAQRLIKEGPTIGAFDHRFTLRTIKVVSDGALGSRGAALLEPYSDDPGNKGILRVKVEELRPMLEEALRKGIQVETHAIGDGANRFILDEYERAFKAVPLRGLRDPRWRDEHTQIVNPADLPRFAKLGIIPSMQPSHAIGDLHFVPSRIGIERTKGAYAWQTLIKGGNMIAGGSDAPVERGEPMIEFYAAVARKDIRGFSGEGWHPEEKVTRDQALKMFTIWAAYAAFEEKLRGSIEVGKLADLTILSADIMKIPEAEILKTHCVMTVIGGEIVFEFKCDGCN